MYIYFGIMHVENFSIWHIALGDTMVGTNTPMQVPNVQKIATTAISEIHKNK